MSTRPPPPPHPPNYCSASQRWAGCRVRESARRPMAMRACNCLCNSTICRRVPRRAPRAPGEERSIPSGSWLRIRRTAVPQTRPRRSATAWRPPFHTAVFCTRGRAALRVSGRGRERIRPGRENAGIGAHPLRRRIGVELGGQRQWTLRPCLSRR
jgi:hypothetical protein